MIYFLQIDSEGSQNIYDKNYVENNHNIEAESVSVKKLKSLNLYRIEGDISEVPECDPEYQYVVTEFVLNEKKALATIKRTVEWNPLALVKSREVERSKKEAARLLLPSDWMVTRKADTGVAIPEKWGVYREAVRYASNSLEQAIQSADSPESLKQIVSEAIWPASPV